MGSNFANELASGDLLENLDQQLSIHFQHNCYPPVPLILIDTAIDAIDAVNDGDYAYELLLPSGIKFRNSELVTAIDVVDALRLHAWIGEVE